MTSLKKHNFVRFSKFIFTLLLVTTPIVANANGMRCGTHLISEGESTYEVIKKCGTPDYEEDLGYVKMKDSLVKSTRLIYEMGSGRFIRILDFEGGKLIKITDGPRQD